MAVKLLALRGGRPLPPARFLVLIFVRGCVDPRGIVRLEGSGKLTNQMIQSEIEPATFRLVAQRLNKLRYRVPRHHSYVKNIIKCKLHIGV
jgi:hypothetical protein